MQGITRSLRTFMVALMLTIVATTSHALDATSLVEEALAATDGKNIGKDNGLDLASNRPDGLVYVYCSMTGAHCKIGVSHRGNVANRNKTVWDNHSNALFDESQVWIVQDLTRREAWAVEYLVHKQLKLLGLWIDPTETKTLEGVKFTSEETFAIRKGPAIMLMNATAAVVREILRTPATARKAQDYWETLQDVVHTKNQGYRDVTQSALLWEGKYIGPKTTSTRPDAGNEQHKDKASGKCSGLNKIEVPGRRVAVLELGLHLARLGACKIAD